MFLDIAFHPQAPCISHASWLSENQGTHTVLPPPVRTPAGPAFHITTRGLPAYAAVFQKTFGFYEGLAAVCTAKGLQGTASSPVTFFFYFESTWNEMLVLFKVKEVGLWCVQSLKTHLTSQFARSAEIEQSKWLINGDTLVHVISIVTQNAQSTAKQLLNCFEIGEGALWENNYPPLGFRWILLFYPMSKQWNRTFWKVWGVVPQYFALRHFGSMWFQLN